MGEGIDNPKMTSTKLQGEGPMGKASGSPQLSFLYSYNPIQDILGSGGEMNVKKNVNGENVEYPCRPIVRFTGERRPG